MLRWIQNIVRSKTKGGMNRKDNAECDAVRAISKVGLALDPEFQRSYRE